jgi:hypothetical protein
MVTKFHAYIHDRGKGLGSGIWNVLLFPYQFTFFTSYFHGAGGIGLAPLAFAPILLMLTLAPSPNSIAEDSFNG